MEVKNTFTTLFFIVLIMTSYTINSKTLIELDTATKDSLENKSYQDLKQSYYNSGNNFDLARIYSHAYLLKAKEEENFIEIANAFHFLSEISKEKDGLKYADSILYYAKESNNKELFIKGNVQKGVHYYFLAEYDKSLEKLLEAQRVAIQEKNEFQQVVVKHFIGNLKNVTNQRKEALEIFRSNIGYFDKKNINSLEEKRQYLKSLFRLANVYNVLRKLDSAEIINKRGIKESLKTENRYMYPLFLACYGSTLQLSGRTDMALDSLKKSAALTNNRKARLASIYLIICKIYNEKKDFEDYEKYLLKIDSMYVKSPETIKETKIAYEALINFYRKNRNPKNQLIFMDKLFEVDSLLDFKIQNVNKNIARKYEKQNLILEKENIIKKLDDRRRKYLFYVLGLGLVIFGLSILVYNFYRKKVRYQQRFHQLMKTQSEKETHPKKTGYTSRKESIPPEILEKILNGLNTFEREGQYLSKNVSLKELSKSLKTNTTYLSYVINSEEKKNFSRYISDLRIQYSIEKIKNDKKFRSYSIKAIANEVGFKSQEAFSKAFYKKTGIYPSYFINNLIKKEVL